MVRPTELESVVHDDYQEISQSLVKLYLRDARAAFRESGILGLARKTARIRMPASAATGARISAMTAGRLRRSGFVLVVLLTPIIRKLCVRWRLYDWPGPLKLHKRPIPRLGGIAIALAIVGGVFLSIPFAATGELQLFTAIPVCIVGAIDDIRALSAAFRFAVQLIAGAILWFGCGRLAFVGSGALGLFASCVLIVGIVNSLNFMDGADGLASGVAGIIGVTYALLPWPAGDRLAPPPHGLWLEPAQAFYFPTSRRKYFPRRFG